MSINDDLKEQANKRKLDHIDKALSELAGAISMDLSDDPFIYNVFEMLNLHRDRLKEINKK